MDRDCLTLAALCSQAVDYPKNGVAVNIDENPLPSLLIRCKPDWHAAEATMPRQTDYYMSTRALGHLYRAIEIEDPSIIHPAQAQEHLTDAISVTLMPLVQRHVLGHLDSDSHSSEIKPLFQRYIDELQYICATYALRSTAKLEEAEVVMGTILAKCNQQRWRKDKIYRMQEHTSVLVQSIRHDFEGHCDPTSSTELSLALERAWCAWDFSLRKNGEFGSNSFGLIALGVILNLLDKVGEIVCNDVVDM
jgi:RNA-dependent RNA polymerase